MSRALWLCCPCGEAWPLRLAHPELALRQLAYAVRHHLGHLASRAEALGLACAVLALGTLDQIHDPH